MKRIVLTYGLVSGVFCSLMMVIGMRFERNAGADDRAMYFGYTLIVLSFLLVFFGIRSYRENQGSGHIGFVRAFGVGISITLITCFFYVATWEVMYFSFMPGFADTMAAHEIEKARASGASPAAVQAKIDEMNRFRQQYRNPLYNSAVTFLEPFPVGLVITLLSAAVLRKRPKAQTADSALPAAN
jgi:hypothetical protein